MSNLSIPEGTPETEAEAPPLSTFSRLFGYHGWKGLDKRSKVFHQIAYRVSFIVGLAALIIGFSLTPNGEDISPGALLLVIVLWYPLFQLMYNLVFFTGSR